MSQILKVGVIKSVPKNKVLDWFKFRAFTINIQPFPKQALVFTCLQYKSFKNTVGKGEIPHNKQFLLFPQSFLSVCRTFCHFYVIWNCRLQTHLVWKSIKFVVWESVQLFAKKESVRLVQIQSIYSLSFNRIVLKCLDLHQKGQRKVWGNMQVVVTTISFLKGFLHITIQSHILTH